MARLASSGTGAAERGRNTYAGVSEEILTNARLLLGPERDVKFQRSFRLH
jgi:hypothetical protein